MVSLAGQEGPARASELLSCAPATTSLPIRYLEIGNLLLDYDMNRRTFQVLTNRMCISTGAAPYHKTYLKN